MQMVTGSETYATTARRSRIPTSTTPSGGKYVREPTVEQLRKEFSDEVSPLLDHARKTLAKLDGTAKGGVLFALARDLKLPIRFIGVGETARDLRPFDAGTFIHAILPVDDVEAAS